MASRNLAIAYRGQIVASAECVSDDDKVTWILTNSGTLMTRRDGQWVLVTTPGVFYFLDIESDVPFMVEENHVRPSVPTGRVFDCTTKTLYDMVRGDWRPLFVVDGDIPN